MRFELRTDNCATTSHRVSGEENINAVFVPNVDPASPEESLRKENRLSSVCWRAAWMTPVCSNHKWTFSSRMHNCGTKWIRPFRNVSSIHRYQQRNKLRCKKLLHFCGSTIKPRRQ